MNATLLRITGRQSNPLNRFRAALRRRQTHRHGREVQTRYTRFIKISGDPHGKWILEISCESLCYRARPTDHAKLLIQRWDEAEASTVGQ
jgi:hypothetical protein